MRFTLAFRHFKKVLLKPRVLIFILTGIGCMFFTFFTHNNAFELGISGIASFFIGIGVNNYTAIETEQREEKRIQTKIRSAVKALRHIAEKLIKIKKVAISAPDLTETEINEMNDYIELCIQYLEEL